MLKARQLPRLLSLFLATEYARFLGGSILCGAINIAVMVCGDALNINYILLSFITYVMSGTAGYFYHAAITFRKSFSVTDYIRFFLGLFLGFPVWLFSMAIMIDYFNLEMWIAAPATTVLLLIYHFFSARLAILWRLQT